MSTSLNNFSPFPILTFWSHFRITGGGKNPIELKIIEKADKTFKSTSSQIQSESNNSDGFIEDPKILEKLGFFRDLAFLDELEDKGPTEEKQVTEYVKQDDAIVNDLSIRSLLLIPVKNKQNINSSTKKISPIRRSKRIAERNLNIESSSNSKIPLSKRQKNSLPFKIQVVARKNALCNLSYGP